MKKAKIIIIGIIFLIPILLYFYIFACNGVSYETIDWANLGSYIGGIYAPVTTIVTAYIAFKIAEHERQTNERISNLSNSIAIQISDKDYNRHRLDDCIKNIIKSVTEIRRMHQMRDDTSYNDELNLSNKRVKIKVISSNMKVECTTLLFYTKTIPLEKKKSKKDFTDAIQVFIEQPNGVNYDRLIETYQLFMQHLMDGVLPSRSNGA